METSASSGSQADTRVPRGITRFCYGRAEGWLVRLQWTTDRGEKKTVRRLFSDGVYGGKGPALEAARAFRVEAELGRQDAREPKRVPGYGYCRRVTRCYRAASGELRQYDTVVALLWDADGKVRSTHRSVAVHGAAGAEAECERWLDAERQSVLQGESELRRAG